MTPDDDSRIAPEFAPVPRRCRRRRRAPAAAPPRRGLESALESVARELLRERRSDRRWRIFFRLAWLLLVVCGRVRHPSRSAARGSAPSGPHTALVEVKGEIDAEAEASAENIVSALKARVRGRRRAGGRAAHQLARRQPGAGRHRQRRDQAPEGQAQEEGLRGGRGDLRVGRVLHRRRRPTRSTSTRQSIVGSIGVLIDGFGFTGTIDKLGVERRLLTAGENKAHARSVLAARTRSTAPTRRR